MVEDKNNLVEKMRELPRVIDSKVEFVSLIKHNRAPNGLINYGPDEISLLKNYLNNLGEKGYLSQKDSAESIFITNKGRSVLKKGFTKYHNDKLCTFLNK